VKILLLGANGQLGQTFLEEGRLDSIGSITPATRDGQLVAGGKCETVDLTSTGSLAGLLERTRPDVIVNAAAYNAVDRAEDEPDLAMRVNRDAVGELGSWAARHDARVVHYSSDYVFDGTASTPYRPGDDTNPLGVYGRSKREGELALAATGARQQVFRTAWVYSPYGSNFLKTMLRLATERPTLQVVADQHGTPTPASLIVEATMKALSAPATEQPQVVMEHVVSSGDTTWYDFARKIFAVAVETGLLMKRPEVEAIASDNFKSRAKRPRYSVLDNSGFVRRYGLPLPSWEEGVRGVLDSLTERDGKVPC
jgi:dTDP-4-dehydrorhamnose reductase